MADDVLERAYRTGSRLGASQDGSVPDWALADDSVFLSFLAGVVDTRACIESLPDGPHITVQSDGPELLQTCWERLRGMGIWCPAPRVDVNVAGADPPRAASVQASWQFGPASWPAVAALLTVLLPHLRHPRRIARARRALMAARRFGTARACNP